MNLVVTDVANRYEVIRRIFATANMLFHVMKLKMMPRI